MGRARLRSLSTRVTVGAVATALTIGGASFWVLQAFYRQQMVDSLADSTTVHGKLVEQTLRYAMHTRSLGLLGEMVRGLAYQKGVEKVMILNKKGVIRFSSNPEEEGRTVPPSHPTCRICHQLAPALRGRTVIFTSEDGNRVFRNVNPILNGETCFGCHPSADRVNGVLIVDYSMAGIRASLDAGARKMWLSALALALAITVVIVVLMRRTVLDRLHALVRTVDDIEAGRMKPVVKIGGADEIGTLAQHLNGMAQSLDSSLRELREREAFLDAVINSADDGIVVVDENLCIVAANRASEAILGARSSASADAPCQCAGGCAGADEQDCPATHTFRTGRVTRRIRTVTSEDGAVRSYEISASPLRGAAPRQRVIEVWRDITQRREIEAQLASSERLASLGLLASGISHEINTPLASIITCLDGLRRRLHGGDRRLPDELPEYLDLIHGEAQRCRDLTERLKVLGRRPREIRQPVNLNSIVDDTLALVRYIAEEKRVTVEVNAVPDLAPILADESQARQVVLNLVMNGLQALDGPGFLRVSTRQVDGGAELEVADSGRGIAPHELPHIFEPFYSQRGDGHGTGLGLFISKIVVDQLGGTIRVSSTPGRGTSFTLCLPNTRSASEGLDP